MIQGGFGEAALGVKRETLLVFERRCWERMAPLIQGRPDQSGSNGATTGCFVKCAVDRAHRLSLARSSGSVRGLETAYPALQPMEHQGCLVAHLRVRCMIDPDFEY